MPGPDSASLWPRLCLAPTLLACGSDCACLSVCVCGSDCACLSACVCGSDCACLSVCLCLRLCLPLCLWWPMSVLALCTAATAPTRTPHPRTSPLILCLHTPLLSIHSTHNPHVPLASTPHHHRHLTPHTSSPPLTATSHLVSTPHRHATLHLSDTQIISRSRTSWWQMKGNMELPTIQAIAPTRSSSYDDC